MAEKGGYKSVTKKNPASAAVIVSPVVWREGLDKKKGRMKMKFVKKMAALLFTCIIVCICGNAVFAANNLTITVTNANPKQSYTLYKIFDATVNSTRESETDNDSSEVTTAGINYTLPTDKSLDKEYTYTDSSDVSHTVKGTDWFTIDAGGNITAKVDANVNTEAFREWAKKFGTMIGEPKTNNTDTVGTLEFTGLSDGYYFMTTTTGSLVTVTSIAPNAIIKDKNGAPTVEKEEDESTNDFGDVVTYTVTVTLVPGTKNVVFHDQLSDGLDLQGTSPGVKVGEEDLNTDNYSVVKFGNAENSTEDDSNGGDNNSEDNNSDEDNNSNDDITIAFAQSYLDSLTDHTTVTISYTAKVNEDAVVNEKNEAFLNYGEKHELESDHAIVYESTFKFQVNKVDGSNDNTALNGAKFVLSTNGELGNLTEELTEEQKAALLKFDASGNQVSADSENPTYILEANNSVTFNGLDGDATGTVYYLYEVKAPDGYNKLTAPIKVTITPTFDEHDNTRVTEYKVSYEIGNTSVDCTATGINAVHKFDVQNNQGTLLPSTGGMGTTLIYIIGAVLVLGAGILLVVKRRMNSDK